MKVATVYCPNCERDVDLEHVCEVPKPVAPKPDPAQNPYRERAGFFRGAKIRKS
jgi:hypothetical protein